MKKILIVEDNPTNMKLVSDLLLAKGYKIIQADTGMEAFKALESGCEQIGLVLLDLKLPDMDGIEVIKKIKGNKTTRAIPVIVVSAHAMESDIKATKEAGCEDYITKPFNIVEFLARVGAFI